MFAQLWVIFLHLELSFGNVPGNFVKLQFLPKMFRNCIEFITPPLTLSKRISKKTLNELRCHAKETDHQMCIPGFFLSLLTENIYSSAEGDQKQRRNHDPRSTRPENVGSGNTGTSLWNHLEPFLMCGQFKLPRVCVVITVHLCSTIT